MNDRWRYPGGALLVVLGISGFCVWRVVENSPARREHYLQSLPLKQLIEVNNQPDADEATHLITIERLTESGESEEAWRIAERVLPASVITGTNDEGNRLRSIAGQLIVEYGDVERGRPLIEESKKIHPDSLRTHIGLGMLFERSGNIGEAYDQFIEATKRNPEAPEPWRRAGFAALAAKMYPEAANALRQSVAHPGRDCKPEYTARIYAALGEALSALGEYPGALEARRKAADMAPSNPDYACLPSVSMAIAARTEPEYKNAVEQLLSSINNNPTNFRLQSMLAGLHMRFGHMQEAKEAQESYIKATGGDYSSWLDLAEICHRLCDDQGERAARASFSNITAIEDAVYEQARLVSTYPNDANVRLNLSVALLKARKYKEAFQALKEAAALDPANPRVQQMMARAQKAIGRSEPQQPGAPGGSTP